MTSEQFIYWLQGFFELTDSKTLSEQQIRIIKDHLGLVFKKETPSYFQEPLPGTIGVPNTTNPYTITCETPDNSLFYEDVYKRPIC